MKISRTIMVSNNTACIDTPIYLYKGDGNILISLDIINITISTKLNQMSNEKGKYDASQKVYEKGDGRCG